MATTESDRLFDRYLEACLDGVVERPEEFLTRHRAQSDGLRRRLDTLYELHTDHAVRRAEPAQAVPDGGLPFERLGDFRLLRTIGEGGMGRLYLAEQESLGRRVALKIVKPELQASPTAIERFRREAFAVAKLQHPHIVRVIATGDDAGCLFLAMELVPGRGLDEILDAGERPSWRVAVEWMRAIASALAYAHDSGVLHRDVKPGNIRITPESQPVLVDFGLARDERWSGQTLTQAFAGSPLYAAPEQLAGRTVDGRVDVYALGVTLFEVVTGRLPFPDGPADQLLHRVLTEEPIAPRKLVHEIPRELEIVLLKALAKAPKDRYASAAAFGADLEAILEDRPITARPPGPVARLRRWARRRPWPAALGAAVIVVLAALGVLAVLRGAERRQRARDIVVAARARLDSYRQTRTELHDTEERVVRLRNALHAKFFDDAEDRLLEESEGAILRARREREAAFYEVLELLQRAQELDAGVAGVDSVRAELYLQRWHESKVARDEVGETFYRELVERFDTSGEFDGELRALRTTQFMVQPADAEVYLFRFERAIGEDRLVPIPWREAELPLARGAFALRVVGGAGGVQRDDLILSVNGGPIRSALFANGERLLSMDGKPVRSLFEVEALDPTVEHVFAFANGTKRRATRLEVATAADLAEAGGVSARIYRDGKTWTQPLPAGLSVRTTAAPAFCSPASRAPLELPLETGRWLAIARKPGYRPLRQAFELVPHVEPCAVALELMPDSIQHPGFVFVSSPNGHDPSFWMMEREVTAQEYLAFLNDPATLARVDDAQQPALFPRDNLNKRDGGYWVRGPNGKFELPDEWQSDWPILGVSWTDAMAYVDWRNARAPDGYTYDLPSRVQWDVAGGSGTTRRRYPWGNRFRPKWTKSCYAQRRASPECVLRYPIDESVYNVYDMAGSAQEWLSDWQDERRLARSIAGGSWAHAMPKRFEFAGTGLGPDVVTGVMGFRLVLVRKR